jgi:hypothetical protein
MPSEPVRLPGGFFVSGRVSVTCDGSTFDIAVKDGGIVLNADSIGSLLKLKKEGEHLISEIKSLSPATSSNHQQKLPDGGVKIMVQDRPVGNLVESSGKISFRPTPLQFFKKLFL